MNHHFLYQEIQFEKSKMNLHFWTKLMNRHLHLELKPTSCIKKINNVAAKVHCKKKKQDYDL